MNIRKFLDEEILYSLLHLDLRSVSLQFISQTINHLSDSLPEISDPSQLENYIQNNPNLQTFCGRIVPRFLGDFKEGLGKFFQNFYSCACFKIEKQSSSFYALKFQIHDDATDEIMGNFECEEPFIHENDEYWLILSNTDSYLDIHFYSRNMKTKTISILQLFVNRIFRMIKKVSQKILLAQLNDTRKARYELIE